MGPQPIDTCDEEVVPTYQLDACGRGASARSSVPAQARGAGLAGASGRALELYTLTAPYIGNVAVLVVQTWALRAARVPAVCGVQYTHGVV